MSLQNSQFVAERAYHILNDNIEIIRNVNHWAELAGFSRGWMWKCIKMHYGKTPNILLRDTRFQKIKNVILEHPNASAKLVASMVAPWTEAHLYNFLHRHYNKNFTILRFEVLNQKTNN